MESNLIYGTYAAAALGALAVFFALPKGARPPRGVAGILGAAALGGLVLLLLRLPGDPATPAFVVLALLAVGSAARVVTHPRPVYSALYFILVVISTAGLAIVAGAQFLAAALVIVYAGAILVTYVFVIMLAQQPGNESERFGGAYNYDTQSREPGAAVLAGFVLLAVIAGVLVGRSQNDTLSAGIDARDFATSVLMADGKPPGAAKSAEAADPGNTLAIGQVLLSDFAVSVELAGVLLMIAMVGAIALARKKVPGPEHEGESLPAGEIGRRVKPF